MASAAVSRFRQQQMRLPRAAIPRDVGDAPQTFTRSFHKSGAVRTPKRTVSLLSAAMEASLLSTYCQVTSFMKPISLASPAKSTTCPVSDMNGTTDEFRRIVTQLHGDGTAPGGGAGAGRRAADFEFTKRSLTVKSGEDGYGFSLRASAPPLVADVGEASSASRAGLRRGDLIIKVNGHDMSSRSHGDLINLINYMPSSPITFTVLSPSYDVVDNGRASDSEMCRAWARHYLPNFLATAQQQQLSRQSPRSMADSRSTSTTSLGSGKTGGGGVAAAGPVASNDTPPPSHTPPLIRPRGSSSGSAVQRHADHASPSSASSLRPVATATSSATSTSSMAYSPVSPMSSDGDVAMDAAERKKMLLMKGTVNIFTAPSTPARSQAMASGGGSGGSSARNSPQPSPARLPAHATTTTGSSSSSPVSGSTHRKASAAKPPARPRTSSGTTPTLAADVAALQTTTALNTEREGLPRQPPSDGERSTDAQTPPAAAAANASPVRERSPASANSTEQATAETATPSPHAQRPTVNDGGIKKPAVGEKTTRGHAASSAIRIAIPTSPARSESTPSVDEQSPLSPRTQSFAASGNAPPKPDRARARSGSTGNATGASPGRAVPGRAPPNGREAFRKVSAALDQRLPQRTPEPADRPSAADVATAKQRRATVVAAAGDDGRKSSSPATVARRLSVRTAAMPAWQWSAEQVCKWLVVNEFDDAVELDKLRGLEGLQLLSLKADEEVWQTLGVTRTKYLLTLINGLRKDLSLEPQTWDEPGKPVEAATATGGEVPGADDNGTSPAAAAALGDVHKSPATTVKQVPMALPRRVTAVTVAQRPQRPPPPPLVKDSSRVSVPGLSPSDVSDWQEAEVDKWLQTFGELEYMLYAEMFAENAVTGHTLLRLDNHKLIGIGVSDQALRKRMLQEVEQLRLCHEEREIRKLLTQPVGRQQQQQQQHQQLMSR